MIFVCRTWSGMHALSVAPRINIDAVLLFEPTSFALSNHSRAFTAKYHDQYRVASLKIGTVLKSSEFH